MKRIFQYTIIAGFAVLLVSCGAGAKEKKGSLGEKKVQLESLKKEQTALATKIKTLEEEIAKLDTAAGANDKAKLIAVLPVTTEDFSHYIDLQGRIDADNISYIAPPNGQGGVVTDIYIKEGQFVKKGQLVLKMDDKILRQQIKVYETQLGLAKELYNRTKNLWDQNIGTEVQLLQAKAQVEGLERQIATANEQIKLFTVYSPVAGIADIVNIKVGELFIGANAAGFQIRIVNNSTLKAVVEVPENYMSRVRIGSPVIVAVPDMNQTYNSTVKLSSQIINPNSRTFTIEAAIPGGTVRPNSVAAVRIKDYSAPGAVVIPVNLVQTDDKGKYVYIVEKDSKGRSVAIKRPVVVGEAYGDKIEIKSGLQPGMQLISEGYQSIYDKQVVTIGQ
ncbi:efflux RND transporter periplasmic adaptor subunit [Lacibacter luteus]|uniref:Efflux RND transporter periplasmic adaptor subunit n=1 Tax=Lacibacter luteus TaxID=2508719 RepID=A0A4Q1CHL9_9BACT|nr:efflux RND transporter periplasmic adaptor subunit [Lacibacter luteus]RXK59701.1 efflux RND transporter periplasmic adaptor subunit [Lacibacter luteus]